MTRVPTTEEFVDMSCRGSRISLERIKQYPNGNMFDELDVRVEPRDAESVAKLQLADSMMMQELSAVRRADYKALRCEAKFPFLLIPRRTNNFMNSMGQGLLSLNRGKRYNPAFLHPSDMETLRLANEDVVKIRSSHGEIFGVVESDESLLPGTIAMTQGFGPGPNDRTDSPKLTGSSVVALIDMEHHDPITGMPRMSGIPVAVAKIVDSI
jgi:anaerobic selenocysteine-containing dehydrogenase